MITYNGNEMMLQNDMGNTLIQDSATGNIMGLNPGFIPVGMKEHGGIMYIASVDKDGYGEIGTIPSPIIRDLYKDKVSLSIGKNIPIDSGDPIQITNKLYPADKFIANLQMTIDKTTLKGIPHKKVSELAGNNNDPCDIILEREVVSGIPAGRIKRAARYSPVISHAVDSGTPSINLLGIETELKNYNKKGIYKLNLYSFFEQGKSISADERLLSAQVYGDKGDKTSLYWFLHTDTGSLIDVFPKDLLNATLNKDLKQVPVSNKPGKLAVKLIPETITDFGMLPRALEPYNTPITYKTADGLYYTYFPGFYYTSDNGLYVEKLAARVIDESTNSTVDLEYPYGKEVSFGRYNLSGLTFKPSTEKNVDDRFYNGDLKLWEIVDDLGLPHAYSSSDPNTYILSPIAGLFNHEQTDFKSSTQGKDDSPHSGVFRAVLGENYNRWYRLEVDYEDQYGGNKGTFTTRFNPYLNDVFGTNLSVNSLDKYPCLQMGTTEIVPELTHEYSPKDTSYTISYKMQIGKHLNTNKFNLALRGCVPSIDSSKSLLEFGKLSLISPNSALFTLQSTSADLNKSKNYHYLYSGSLHPTTDGISIDGLRFYQNDLSFISKSSNNSVPKKLLSYNTNSYDFNREVRTQHTIFTKNWKFKIDEDNKTCLALTYWALNTWHPKYKPDNADYPFSDAFSAPIDRITFDAPDYYDNYVLNQILELNNINDLPLTITVLSDKFYRQYSKTSSDILYNEDINVFPNHPVTMILYELTEGSDPLFLVFNFSYELSPITVKTDSYQLNPSYSIVPYFILQGTNDKGIKVPVQRFGKLLDLDVVYEHNFEHVNDEAKNFIEESSNNVMDSTPCSYNENNNQFLYYLDNFSTSLKLDAGIYVLNIQRCPGVGNWTQSGADPIVNLKIQIGEDTIYSYPKQDGTKPIENWSITALDTNKYKYKTSHGETSNMRIYVPIVLIVREASEVSINIYAEKGWTFNRQSIGLYKINNVAGEDILQDLIDLEEQVYLYHDYMKIVSEMAENHDTDKVKQYSFMLKYGVFFKEAFVFVDGLYKDNNVNSITIGEKTYQPYPYIPSDSSILPVLLGAGNNYYWNTYYMPEEVLDSDDCNFIFSNADRVAIIDTFKSVKSGNLRQLINQE